MLMRVEVVLTIFIVSLTFGTVAELQVVPVQLCPAADRAFMMGLALRFHFYLGLKILPAPDLTVILNLKCNISNLQKDM